MQGMRESSDYGRTREETMYWKSLSPWFKVDLLPGFGSKLEIPEYFTENVKAKLPHEVNLRGPGSDLDTWKVQLKTTNNTTSFVGPGWEEFANAFSLKEHDTLVFKFKNNSYFKVRVFSGRTSCESESSHFVTKCDQFSHQGKDIAPLNSIKQEIGSDENISCKRSYVDPLESPRNVQVKTEAEFVFSSPRTSSNRDQTAMDIRRARQRAEELQRLTKNSFFVALSRSHVNGNMKLAIPKHWWNEMIKSSDDKCMKLGLKGENDSSYMCYCSYDKSNSTGVITSGWKKFAQENSLYEYDCCVFSLAKPFDESSDLIHMEIEIVRGMIP